MKQLVQGDVYLIRRDAIPRKAKPVPPEGDGSVVLAHGEVTGHRHRFIPTSKVALYHDAALARSIPGARMLEVPAGGASLLHEEHPPINVPGGVYEVRQQRRVKINPEDDTDYSIERAID